MPDERLRAAREFLDNYTEPLRIRDGDHARSIEKFAAAFAKEREDSAMREAAGLVCAACEDTELYETAALRIDKINPSRWMHKAKELVDHYTYCAAGPIHEHLARKGAGG
jgi:hypothetical protein